MKRYLLFMLILFPIISIAATLQFQAGQDYEIILQNASIPTPPADKVTVTEFFSYGCPWCYKLEPALSHWVKQLPTEISFIRVPVIFEKHWEMYAKAYYIAIALNIADKITPVIFSTIQDKNQELATNAAMIKFFTTQGVDPKIISSAFEASPTLDIELAHGMQLMQAYQVTVVPTLVVNSKYRTDLRMAKGNDQRLLNIVNFLIEKVKTEKKVR